jgi:hypothetical protein
MSCYEEDDVKGVSEKTVAKLENWQQLAKIYNEVQQKRYETWLEQEKSRIRMDAVNANMTEQEVLDLALSHLPEEYKGVPERSAMLSLSVLSAELAASIDGLSESNDATQLMKLREILRDGYLAESWRSPEGDKYVETVQIEQFSKEILDKTKACTDATTDQEAQDKDCATEKFPNPIDPSKEDIKVYLPASIKAQINKEAIKRGEPVEKIVEWWQQYYAKRTIEKKKQELKVSEKISPFKFSEQEILPKAASGHERRGPDSAKERLNKALESAISRAGVNILRRE